MGAKPKIDTPKIPVPKGVGVASVKVVFYQDSDTCQEGGLGQDLTVETEDGGGGPFPVISTTRWSMDHDELDQFVAMVKGVLALVPEDKP